jgi:hypothetical protein
MCVTPQTCAAAPRCQEAVIAVIVVVGLRGDLDDEVATPSARRTRSWHL